MKKYKVLHVRLDKNKMDYHAVTKRSIIHHTDKTYKVGALYNIHRRLYLIIEDITSEDDGGNDASV